METADGVDRSEVKDDPRIRVVAPKGSAGGKPHVGLHRGRVLATAQSAAIDDEIILTVEAPSNLARRRYVGCRDRDDVGARHRRRRQHGK